MAPSKRLYDEASENLAFELDPATPSISKTSKQQQEAYLSRTQLIEIFKANRNKWRGLNDNFISFFTLAENKIAPLFTMVQEKLNLFQRFKERMKEIKEFEAAAAAAASSVGGGSTPKSNRGGGASPKQGRTPGASLFT